MAQVLNQGLRQSGQTWTDFDHGVACLRVNVVDDGVDDAVVRKEVLTETFTRNVFH
jgi:hypothetical protein